MSKWILILVLDYHGTAMTKIEGFTSKETCEIAAQQIDTTKVFWWRNEKICIEVK